MICDYYSCKFRYIEGCPENKDCFFYRSNKSGLEPTQIDLNFRERLELPKGQTLDDLGGENE